MKNCQTCEEMTKEFLKENPAKKGYVMCLNCYEKSKEFLVYPGKPDPDRPIYL